jgi:cytochrome c oxidase cbb3-type subunit III
MFRVLQLSRRALPLLFLLGPIHLVAQFASPVPNPASADRGDAIYAKSCAKCHGDDARGTATAPDLLRSLAVLHDRLNSLHGKELAPILAAKPVHGLSFSDAEILDISQSLTRSVNKILRTGYSNQPTDLLKGDKTAGEAYFNGAGGCNKCHSTTGDLAHVSKKYDVATLQQKFLFPNSGVRGVRTAAAPVVKKTQVTVTPAGKPAISGELVRMDDFTVTLRDATGQVRTWTILPTTKVKTDNPYAGHVALLEKYTDTDIYNLTAFLETLK